MTRRWLILLCVVLAACALTGCIRIDRMSPSGTFRNVVREDGVREERTYNEGEFDAITVDGDMRKLQIYFSSGENAISIECDSAYFDSLDISTRNGTLRIDTPDTLRETIYVYVTAPTYTKIDCRGAAELNSEDTLQGESLAIVVAGACSGRLDIEYDDVLVDIAGAGDLALTGTAERLEVDCAGACTIQARELTTQFCTIDVAGAGEVKVRCEQELDTSISGVGSVEYWGNPVVNKHGAGFGTVSRKGD